MLRSHVIVLLCFTFWTIFTHYYGLALTPSLLHGGVRRNGTLHEHIAHKKHGGVITVYNKFAVAAVRNLNYFDFLSSLSNRNCNSKLSSSKEFISPHEIGEAPSIGQDVIEMIRTCHAHPFCNGVKGRFPRCRWNHTASTNVQFSVQAIWVFPNNTFALDVASRHEVIAAPSVTTGKMNSECK
jgi:hypothetical protein